MIDIKGMDKASILQVLYDNSCPSFMPRLPRVPLSYNEASTAVSKCTDFDYYNGVLIKCRLGGDEFDPRSYDRDNGDGAAARLIDTIR